MATLEQVEKLREKANVTYEEAKAALEASGDDLLEAFIYLEKKGKVNPPAGGGYYSSGNASGAKEAGKESLYQEAKSYDARGESFGDMMKRFGRFCAKLIGKGNNNFFEAEKNGNVVISLPVTVLVIAVIFLFWIIVPLTIIGFFFGFRYHFRGRDLGKESVNKVFDTASNAAENLKKSFNEKK